MARTRASSGGSATRWCRTRRPSRRWRRGSRRSTTARRASSSGCSSTRRSTPPGPARARRPARSGGACQCIGPAAAGNTPITGPGQRIAYVMLDLERRGRDVRCHVWRLEEWIIRDAGPLRCQGRAPRRPGRRMGRRNPRPGGSEDKIAAIGVRVRHWVTYHGLALNVDPDLGHYRGIVPCGIDPASSGHGVTSLTRLGITASMAEVDIALRATFEEVFGGHLSCVRCSAHERGSPRFGGWRLRVFSNNPRRINSRGSRNPAGLLRRLADGAPPRRFRPARRDAGQDLVDQTAGLGHDLVVAPG